MYKNIICVVLSVTLLFGCGTTLSKKINIPEPISLEDTPIYEQNYTELKTEFTNILQETVNNIKYVQLVNGVYVETDMDNATHVLFSSESYENISKVFIITDGLFDVLEKNTELINGYISIINQYKNNVELERQRLILATEGWQASEQNFEQEHKLRNREKIIHTVSMIAAATGAIFLLAL